MTGTFVSPERAFATVFDAWTTFGLAAHFDTELIRIA